MIGKDLSRLETLINQLEVVREKEIEKEEEAAKEAAEDGIINPAQDLLDRVGNILEENFQNANTVYERNSVEGNNVENTIEH